MPCIMHLSGLRNHTHMLGNRHRVVSNHQRSSGGALRSRVMPEIQGSNLDILRSTLKTLQPRKGRAKKYIEF